MNEHGAVAQNRRVAESRHVGVQIFGDGVLHVVPTVADDVVHDEVGGETLCTVAGGEKVSHVWRGLVLTVGPRFQDSTFS